MTLFTPLPDSDGGGPDSPAVMIVEDDFDIREAVRDVLTDEGFSVCEASNGHEALALLQTIRPKLILLDLNMPIMNGSQFLRMQQRTPSIATIPTVIMSAVDRLQEQLGELRPTDTLAKPLKGPELLSMVRKHCS